MHIDHLSLFTYKIPLTNHQQRSGIFIKITDQQDRIGWGEIAPLPIWSHETLDECFQQIVEKISLILSIQWTISSWMEELNHLQLFPSVSFGLESALLSILSPQSKFQVSTCALLMGSCKQILDQATLRYHEGYTHAKLKVSHLSFEEAALIINQLKEKFRLRIDVNCAWKTEESLRFFSQFPCNTFDYVEEPFKNPNDLISFTHPLAIDESFPNQITYEFLEKIPKLKTIVFKPTLQGGSHKCTFLFEWIKKRNLNLVLSSSYESDLGLASIATMANRLKLIEPLGIGTFHFLTQKLCEFPLYFTNSNVIIPSSLTPKMDLLWKV
ncbi:MAG: o-succinylbenzoate synthase [Parachlamydiaceae bacterium]|nr:o-succinylbenzoate synthase [Parachlamydiaceae bacterium]